jgi:hypothetical protein
MLMVQGFVLLPFGKPGISRPQVCRNMLRRFLHHTIAFLSAFKRSPFITHFPLLFNMSVVVGVYHTFFVFIRSLFHTSVNKTYNQSFSPFTHKQPINDLFFEVL